MTNGQPTSLSVGVCCFSRKIMLWPKRMIMLQHSWLRRPSCLIFLPSCCKPFLALQTAALNNRWKSPAAVPGVRFLFITMIIAIAIVVVVIAVVLLLLLFCCCTFIGLFKHLENVHFMLNMLLILMMDVQMKEY